ncbi:MAG: hypothetical protein HY575_08685 [candidate division NC10 bacterium]|nr:hypothetical protein [candidate division NC10 bacterium]
MAALLAVAAAACSDRPLGPPKPGSIRVAEGVGWEGKLVLGDPLSRVQKVLGDPHVLRTVGAEEELDYGFVEVTVEKGSEKVVALLFREGWVTASGLAQGAKPEAVVAVYGALPTRWYPLMRYERRGVTFMLSPELTFDAQGKPEGWVAHWVKVYPVRR